MSDATTHRLKVSREGVVLIKSFEGFRPRAVRDGEGRWVIGYGHRASAREGLTVGEQDAELLLQYDLLPVVKALHERVSAPLNQHQFDALASFAVSVGLDRFLASDVLRRLNEGHPGEAADALIGWPEPAPVDARLRRRAAERALFVASPDAPVALADLLAAPLPPPPVEPAPDAGAVEAPVVRPDFSSQEEARAAAVASLLGEAPMPTADPVVSEPPPSPPPAPSFQSGPLQAAAPVTTIHQQRYSPYAAPMIGPLPGFPPAAKDEARPVGADEPASSDGPQSEPRTEPEAGEDTRVAAEPPSATAAEPVLPLVPPEPGASPFPPMDEPLVLSPATESDFADPARPVWDPQERSGPSVVDAELVLFDETPSAPVLRHETEAVPARRFDWSQTGAYLTMGLIGLAACAFSAAAFRKAMAEDSFLGDFTLIGWVLAFIGVICVGVSSWHLIRQWARRD